MKVVIVEHEYPFEKERLWALVTDYDALETVMKGIVAFEGLPDGKVQAGQKIDVMVSLFGKLPKQPYFMEVLECDELKMVFRSSEKGAGVREWRHTLSVVETETGCRLTDRIEIDAGLLTPLFALWAEYLYKARHKPRLRLLEQGLF